MGVLNQLCRETRCNGGNVKDDTNGPTDTKANIVCLKRPQKSDSF